VTREQAISLHTGLTHSETGNDFVGGLFTCVIS